MCLEMNDQSVMFFFFKQKTAYEIRLSLVGSLLHPHWAAQLLMAGLQVPTLSLTPQLVSGVQFLVRHPDAARDVLAYAMAGAAGQIAIFETLERFGSLTLVSITVRTHY